MILTQCPDGVANAWELLSKPKKTDVKPKVEPINFRILLILFTFHKNFFNDWISNYAKV